MARQRRKSNLPTKICPVCGKPFTWRKKWEKCWDEVKYCSERCRRRRSLPASAAATQSSNLDFTEKNSIE